MEEAKKNKSIHDGLTCLSMRYNKVRQFMQWEKEEANKLREAFRKLNSSAQTKTLNNSVNISVNSDKKCSAKEVLKPNALAVKNSWPAVSADKVKEIQTSGNKENLS